jgi:hypothetical protein
LAFGDAIYVVTDAGDNKSRMSIAQLKQELTSRGIRIFAFVLQHEGPQSEEENEGASELEDLANFTGGDVVQISSADIGAGHNGRLEQLAPRVVGEIENVYRVELGLAPGERVARVKVSLLGTRHKGSVGNFSYSHQITSCSPPRPN